MTCRISGVAVERDGSRDGSGDKREYIRLGGESWSHSTRINADSSSPEFLKTQQTLVLPKGVTAPYGFRGMAVNEGRYLALTASTGRIPLTNYPLPAPGNVYVIDLHGVTRNSKVDASVVATLNLRDYPLSRLGKGPLYISSGDKAGQFLVSNAKDFNWGVAGVTFATDSDNGNLTGDSTLYDPTLTPASTSPNWLQNKFQQNIQRAAGTVIVNYQGKTYALVADYNFLFNDAHFGNSDILGKQIGGKIGVIQDPFGVNGEPVYLGATTPIPNVALNQLMLDQNGMLYATAFVEDTSGHYTNNTPSDLMYNSMFVWNASQLVQAALDAQQAGRKLILPIDRTSVSGAQLPAVTPARYDTTPNGQLFGWIYGEGTYSASQNVSTLTLQNVPYLQALAPSVFEEAKTAAQQAHEPVAKDTSNGTWNTAMILAGAQVTETFSFMAASLQSVFGMDNSAMLAKMNEAKSVMDTIGFDTQASGLGGLAAKGTELVTGFTGGLLSIGMNTAGYAMRGFAETENLFHPGFVKDMPAPTDLLQLHDSGATIGEQINHVATAFIMPVVDGGLALVKGSADLMLGNWISARNNLMDGLATLLMFKGGGEILGPKVAELKNKLQLEIKQAVFKAQEVMQGIITKSPLEFLRKGPEGKEVIITEKTLPSSDPAVPPVKVTEVKTVEQAAKECDGSLQMNADGSVEFVDPFTDPVCFVAGTLVHTKDGLKPIEQIKVGDYVLSRPDSGEDEQAYKKVTKTFASENKEVWVVDYVYNNEPRARSLVVTANHPFWVKGKGWTAAKDLGYPDCFEIHNPGEIIERCFIVRALPIYETNISDVGWAYSTTSSDATGPTIDLRNNQLKVSSCYEEDVCNDFGLDAWTAGLMFKQRVYNLEVEDFHTYYVGEPGVWVHNTCPNIAGTVENVKVALNNPAEAAAGLSPSIDAYVYSEYGGHLISSNLESMGLPKQGVVLGLKSLSENDAANALAATQPGSMKPDNAYLAAHGYTSQYGYAVEWGVLLPNSKTGGRDTLFFESRLTAETPEGLLAYTRTFNDVKMSFGPIYELNSSGTIADFSTRFARTETLVQIRKGYDMQQATGANAVYTVPDVLPAKDIGMVLHNMTPLQQGMKLMQDEVINKGYQWADAWMFRDIAKPDVFYSFNEANLLPGAIQVQITFPDGTLGPTLWKGEAKLSTEPIANDYTTGSLAGNTAINAGLTTAYLYTTSQGISQSIAPLVQADIDALLPAAKQYWLNAGALSSVLDGIQINIGQLPAAVAAQAQYNKITLSADGAGWGWFVDTTPLDSLEFINATSAQWIAPADSIASGKLDLLTVMIHEMGHALGLQHDASGAMEALLQPGARNLPSDLEAALLQNIRNAVTAKPSNNAGAGASLAMQYQAVTNPAFANLDTAGAWQTQGSVDITPSSFDTSGRTVSGTATLNEILAAQTRKPGSCITTFRNYKSA